LKLFCFVGRSGEWDHNLWFAQAPFWAAYTCCSSGTYRFIYFPFFLPSVAEEIESCYCIEELRGKRLKGCNNKTAQQTRDILYVGGEKTGDKRAAICSQLKKTVGSVELSQRVNHVNDHGLRTYIHILETAVGTGSNCFSSSNVFGFRGGERDSRETHPKTGNLYFFFVTWLCVSDEGSKRKKNENHVLKINFSF
jgi:hypothetical protein